VLLQDRHVRIELLVDVLPKSIQRALGIAVCLIAFAACVVLAWKTSVAALQYYDRGIMMPRIWRIPRIYPYSIIPIGSMFLGTVFLVRLRLYISETDPESALHKRASAGQETGFSDESVGIE
jgi:TRAP-type C4-dicarboxylate transport system permease small subunit